MSEEKQSEEKQLKKVTVYKENGKELKVNTDMLPYLESLGLSKSKPK